MASHGRCFPIVVSRATPGSGGLFAFAALAAYERLAYVASDNSVQWPAARRETLDPPYDRLVFLQ